MAGMGRKLTTVLLALNASIQRLNTLECTRLSGRCVMALAETPRNGWSDASGFRAGLPEFRLSKLALPLLLGIVLPAKPTGEVNVRAAQVVATTLPKPGQLRRDAAQRMAPLLLEPFSIGVRLPVETTLATGSGASRTVGRRILR